MNVQIPAQPDWQQALRYLGVRGEPDPATEALLHRAEAALRQAAQPRAVTVFSDRDEMNEYCLGTDVQKHLKGCTGCVLLGCSLGAGVDTAMRAASAGDMAYAVVLDALASVLIEMVADQAEHQLREAFRQQGLFLTGRFSPGYGDWPIEVQNDLVRILDAPRKIGLCATETHLLVPRKSITAIMGTADHPVSGQRAGCAHCTLREKCRYRKEGKTCEASV